MDLQKLVKEILQEKKVKRDRCLRIADRKFDKPSAYKSGAVVRCRQGKIWKGIKETNDPQSGKAAPYGSGYAELKKLIQEIINEDESLYKWFKRSGPKGKEGGWVDCNAPDGKGGYKDVTHGLVRFFALLHILSQFHLLVLVILCIHLFFD